jgi:hypothetical protein
MANQVLCLELGLTYISIPAELGRVVDIGNQSLPKVMYGQGTRLSRAIRAVAIAVQSDMPEPGLVRQPFLGPEHAGLWRVAPCLF